MNGRQFARYLSRDLACPCGCQGREDTYVPQHRANRGAGGSKLLDRPSNILVMCSSANWLMEADASYARCARENGWKLARWMSPEETPFLDLRTMTWHLLDNDFNRTPTDKAA